MVAAWILVTLLGVGAIVAGAELFAEHLAASAARLGVSTFALAVLLAGAEPEELATSVVASLRGAPAIAFGDVIGANVAICLVAIGVGAVVSATPLPFDRQVRRYALAGLPAGALAAGLAWDGTVTRLEGLVLVAAYVVFVATIWSLERQPPALGETGEIEEQAEALADAPAGASRRVGRELALVLVGLALMAVGASALVEGIRRVTDAEDTQTRLGLVVVGFATAFELVVLAWSAARRGITAAVVAGVVGSFTYNVTMTLGAGALASPLRLIDGAALHGPWLVMLASLALVIALGWSRGGLGRAAGVACLAGYPVAVVVMLML